MARKPEQPADSASPSATFGGDLFAPAPLPVARLDDAQRLACLRLIRSENVGPVTFRELINHFGGATNALKALPEMARRAGRRRPIRICPEADAMAELEAASRVGATPVFTIEPGYSPALAALDVPPPMIYARGRLELLTRDALAMVGSRNASAASMGLARQLADGVGRAGFVIVSGLARGIDAAAHDASLATGTVAVLAGGIDFVYPPENAVLHERIAEAGCLVSDQPPGFRPRGQDFPRRNRIISGLSLAVLVVEAARRSGSLITAHAAADQGRPVLAVPGHPLDPRSEGPNALLKGGATLITSTSDVLEQLEPMRTRPAGLSSPQWSEPAARTDWSPPASSERPAPASLPAATPGAATDAVLAALGPHPATVDEIARATGHSVASTRIALLELALAGLIEQHGQQLVSLRPQAERGG